MSKITRTKILRMFELRKVNNSKKNPKYELDEKRDNIIPAQLRQKTLCPSCNSEIYVAPGQLVRRCNNCKGNANRRKILKRKNRKFY